MRSFIQLSFLSIKFKIVATFIARRKKRLHMKDSDVLQTGTIPYIRD